MGRFAQAVALFLMGAAYPAAADQAIFAGGCFWCMERAFEHVSGVLDVETGYAGSDSPPADYAAAASGRSGHLFAVRVSFDSRALPYGDLLESYWRQIDPADAEGQFCERGRQYRAAIIALEPRQAAAARVSRDAFSRRLGGPVTVEILPALRFWPAEAEHQDFARRNPRRYDFFRRSCGVDERLARIWRPSKISERKP